MATTDFIELLRGLDAELVSQASSTAQALVAIAGIYGRDDRMELSDLDPRDPLHLAMLEAASGVALIVNSTMLQEDGDSVYLTASPDCMSGKYQGQPAVDAAAKTAFLINAEHVLTAGHVVNQVDPQSLSVVFGYRQSSLVKLPDGHDAYRFPKTHTRPCAEAIFLACSDAVGDIALLRLDVEEEIPATVASPLKLAPRRSVQPFDEVAMLGFPRRQPIKAVARAAGFGAPRAFRVGKKYIYTNVDSLQGNSGSPLLDASGRVIGVQAGGDRDRVDCKAITYPDDAAGSWATCIEVAAQALAGIGVYQPFK